MENYRAELLSSATFTLRCCVTIQLPNFEKINANIGTKFIYLIAKLIVRQFFKIFLIFYVVLARKHQ